MGYPHRIYVAPDVLSHVKAFIRRNLVGGIVVVAPIAITLFVVVWIYRKVSTLPSAEVMRMTGVKIINDLIQVAFSVFVLVIVLMFIGYIARTAMGVIVKDELDRVVETIPLIRVVYKATRTGIEAIAGGKSGLKEPVKLGFGGLRLTAFKTGGKTEKGREIVFLPTAPNITSGFVIEADQDSLEKADETVEEALTRILSAGFGADDEEIKELLIEGETVSEIEENEEEANEKE